MCSLYKKRDSNNDGKVTSVEVKTLLVGIQMQADGERSEDLVDSIIGQLDITGDGTIDEDKFVNVLTKWLHDARKSLSRNDYNPLSFFTKHQANGDEEQEILIPKKTNVDDQSSIFDYLEAFALIYSGLFTSNMSNLSTFLLTVNIKDIPWDVAAEVLVVLVIGVVMGIFTSTRTVFLH
ncbi:putative EF-hand domain pair protein CML [Helianthus anomalus]